MDRDQAFCHAARGQKGIGDIGWHERLVSDFRAFRDDARSRPPRTFEDLERRGRTSRERFESLAEPFSRFVTRTDPSSLRFERVSRDERGEIVSGIGCRGTAAFGRRPQQSRQTNVLRHANSESSYCYRSKIMPADEEPRRSRGGTGRSSNGAATRKR